VSDTVLITGGLGYLGGRIVQKLTGDPNYSLRLGTRRSSAVRPKWLEEGNLVQMDLKSGDNLDAACKGARWVIHLAALNEVESEADPEEALLVNSMGTLKLLRAAERAGVERFIYFSTAHIYGSPLVGGINEETLPRPIHPYAITHKVAEDFVLSSNDQKKLTGIVLRLSNGLGAPTDAQVNRWMLVGNDLCRQAVTGGKLVLKSSGMQKRDFIALSDVGRATIHFLHLPISQCDNGIFNLGGENSLRIIDLAGRIKARCKAVLKFTPPIIRPEPHSMGVSEDLDYRIDKLKNTGFSLKSNLDEEIDMTLRLCQKAFGRKR
jgi:UDP-glucose 4-epimerase